MDLTRIVMQHMILPMFKYIALAIYFAPGTSSYYLLTVAIMVTGSVRRRSTGISATHWHSLSHASRSAVGRWRSSRS